MREIKFRVWDIDGNQFWDDSLGDWKIEFLSGKEPNLIVLEETFSPVGEQEFYWRDVDNVVFQQYTGLKDRNGKDIYEGDIVKVESTLVYPFDNKIPVDPPKKSIKYYRIGWHKNGCWNKFDGMSDEHKGIVGINQPHIWCEVVGNIYQNSKLIEGETKQ